MDLQEYIKQNDFSSHFETIESLEGMSEYIFSFTTNSDSEMVYRKILRSISEFLKTNNCWDIYNFSYTCHELNNLDLKEYKVSFYYFTNGKETSLITKPIVELKYDFMLEI